MKGTGSKPSSMMALASSASAAVSSGQPFLKEHRRCYDEIIGYCNELLYEGKLEPKRGRGEDDENRPLASSLPIFGYKNVPSSTSERSYGSRINLSEAKSIAAWLKENMGIIVESYRDKAGIAHENDSLELWDCVSIVTPFSKQEAAIRKQISTTIDARTAQHLTIGTAHKLQGAEKPIVLFSLVYGSNEEPSFLKRNLNLLNVAVSRAKDSFIIFCDYRTLGKLDILCKYAQTPIPDKLGAPDRTGSPDICPVPASDKENEPGPISLTAFLKELKSKGIDIPGTTTDWNKALTILGLLVKKGQRYEPSTEGKRLGISLAEGRNQAGERYLYPVYAEEARNYISSNWDEIRETVKSQQRPSRQ